MAFSWFFPQQASEGAPLTAVSSTATDEKPAGVLNKAVSVEASTKDFADARTAVFARGPRLLSRHHSASSRRRSKHVGPVQIEFDDDDEPHASFSYTRPPSQPIEHRSSSDSASGGSHAGQRGVEPRCARERERKNRERAASLERSSARSMCSGGEHVKTARFHVSARRERAAQRFNTVDDPENVDGDSHPQSPQRGVALKQETSVDQPHVGGKEPEDDADLVVGAKPSEFAFAGRRRRTLSHFPSRLGTLPSLRSFPLGSQSGEGRTLTASREGHRGFREGNPRVHPPESRRMDEGDSSDYSGVSPAELTPREGETSRTVQVSGDVFAETSARFHLPSEIKPSKRSISSLRQPLGNGLRGETESTASPDSSAPQNTHVTASQSRPPQILQGPLPASTGPPEKSSTASVGRHPLRTASARVSFAATAAERAAETRGHKAKDEEQRLSPSAGPSPRKSLAEGEARKMQTRERHRPRSPSSSASTRVSELDTARSSSSSTSLPPVAQEEARHRSDDAKGTEETAEVETGPQKVRASSVSGRPPCEHILLVVHGIGCEAEGGAIHKQQFVKSLALVNEYWFWKKPVEVHVHAINWKQTVIHAQEHMFEHITLKDVYETRRMLTLTAADLLFFLTPRYGDFIMTQVAEQLNEAVAKLRAHPSERYKNSKISVLGYSLGSVMAYELLAGRPFRPSLFNPTTNPSPRLNFHVDSLFLLGSALPAFLLLHAPEILKQGMWLPKDLRLYNIFHPCDPVAFRLEKLVYPQIRQLPPPVLLAFWRTNGVQKWYEWDMNVQHAKNVLMQNITDFASTISNSLFFWWNPEKGNPNPEGISVLDSNASAASAALEEAKKTRTGLLSSSFSSSSLVGPLVQKSKAGQRDADGLRDGDTRNGGKRGGSAETPGRGAGGDGARRTHRRVLDSARSSSAKLGDENTKQLPLRPADMCAFRMRLKQTLPHVLRRHRAAESSEDEDVSLPAGSRLLPRLPPLPSLGSSLSSSLASADLSSSASSQLDVSPRSSSAASSTASAEETPHSPSSPNASEREQNDSRVESRSKDADTCSSPSPRAAVQLYAGAARETASGDLEKAKSGDASSPGERENQRAALTKRGSELSATGGALPERDAETGKDRSGNRRVLKKEGDADSKQKREEDRGARTRPRGEEEEGDGDQNIWHLLYRSNSKEKPEDGAVSDVTTSSAGSGAFALEQLEQLEQETSRAMAQLETINEQTGPDILPVRVDFQLQEDTAEHFLSSLAMLQSHFNYWKLKDVAFFILKCLTGTNPTLSYTGHLKQLECAARKAAAKAERESNEVERRRQLKLAAALHRRLDSFNGTSEGTETSRKSRQPHAKHGSSPQGGTLGKRHSLAGSENYGREKSKHRQSVPGGGAIEVSSDGESHYSADRKGSSSAESERDISTESGSSKAQSTYRSRHSEAKANGGNYSTDSSSAESMPRAGQESEKSARKRHLEKRQQRANERLSTHRTVTKSFK
ncbi:DDHD domain-containing protein [Toxoplasma gondii CAST]|uniref:DDHD domain-containing protein n=1 Tax=Toxoplasma gondii CAST TaxID=943122 RepID=A0A425I269_TOXGO|nr:DDHD domain-containing protein [Toxoplasma gondii CAST]